MKINDTVRLSDGRRGKILATPSGFLSNGEYEIQLLGNTNPPKARIWVKEDEILYVINLKHEDDLNKYFEVIYDENGINVIPKNLLDIEIIDSNEELKTIEFNLGEGEKHNKVSFHIGNTDIWSSEKPKPNDDTETKENKKHRLL